MGGDLSLLPEAQPDDAEDVAWGLQTAAALWGRGEHREAVVWLRRAIGAARDAGAEERAAALELSVGAIERTLVDAAAASVVAEGVEATPSVAAPGTAATSTPLPLPAAVAASNPPPAPKPASLPKPRPPSFQQIDDAETLDADAAAALLLDESTSDEPPPAPVVAAPVAPVLAAQAAPVVATPAAPVLAVPPSSAGATPIPRPARPPAEPPASEPPQSYAPPSMSSMAAPPSTLVGRASIAPVDPPAASTAGSASAQRARKARAPILDPWSDDLPPDEPAPRTLAHRPEHSSDEADVITSAPSLEVLFRKRPPPPPPPAKRSQTLSGTPLIGVAPELAATSLTPPPPQASQKPPPPPAPGSRPGPMPPLPRPALPSLPPTAEAAESPAPQASMPPVSTRTPAERPSTPPEAPPSAVPRPASQRPSVPPPPSAVPRPTPGRASVPPAAPAERPSAPPAEPAERRSVPPAQPAERPSVPPAQPAAETAPVEAAPARAPVEAAPAAAPAATSAGPRTLPPEQRSIDGVELGSIDALGDVPDGVQAELAGTARRATLGFEEELGSEGAVLLLEGEVVISVRVSDVAATRASAPALLPCWSSSSEAPALKLTALRETRIASWPREQLTELLGDCPWVLEELERRGDRLAALAGATMGLLGDLDDSSRDAVFERLELRALAAGERWLAKGESLAGLAVLGVGNLRIGGELGAETLSSGDLVLPTLALEGGSVPSDVVAGERGALVLTAAKGATLELFSTVPSLLELLRIA